MEIRDRTSRLGRRQAVPVLAAVTAFVAGLAVGIVISGASEPCWQVLDEFQPVRDRLSATAGEDPEVVERAATITSDRPDCFDPQFVEFLQQEAEDIAGSD